jgi:hypothetical protein
MSTGLNDRSPLLDPSCPRFSEGVSHVAMRAAFVVAVIAAGIVASAIIHGPAVQYTTQNPLLATADTAP